MSGRQARPTSEELQDAVTESISVAEVLRRLGLPESGTQRRHLRLWIAEDRLATEHFLGQAHQRGSAARPQADALKTCWSSRTEGAGHGPLCCVGRCTMWAYPKNAPNAAPAPSGSASP